MRLRSIVFLLFFTLGVSGLHAQTTLYAENFDLGCVLPAGWLVNFTGNQNPTWYVGNALQNDDQNGLSMNGSCFLVIDDDATGNNTPAYVASFTTPAFDASQYPTVSLSVDVHYRDYGDAAESFKVYVTDGVTETLLRSFSQGQSTGDSLFEFTTLKFDLSFFTASPNTRIIFRYDDAGGFAWWAGFDNIRVVGSGQGQNIVKETFNTCAKPAGWETQIVTGEHDWQFGYVTNPKTTYAGTSMDGTCMAFFDDDILGDSALFSTVRLMSPWFDGSQFGRFELNFDVIMRYVSEKISVIVQHADGSEYLVVEAAFDIGGPHFPNYIHAALDLSPYRSQQMRVIFEYDDGQDFAWWVGLDNIKITGSGVANDICTNAIQLFTGANCLPSNNRTALFDGPVPACINKPVAGLWYGWQADFTGLAKLSSGANFNDVVNVFTGDCTNPQAIVCDDHDEHGFTGEGTYFNAQAGTIYYFRVCGKEGGFGVSRGDLCIKLEQVNTPPAIPGNDECSGALPLVLDAPCVAGTNLHASNSATIPSLNDLARADVWYSFIAPALVQDEVLRVKSNANFSDILTVYKGGCNNLVEAAGNHKGGELDLNNLAAGETYYLQIAGNFATVEGAVCPQLVKVLENAPANDNCLSATPITVGAACTAGSNIGASFSGLIPPCVPSVARDIWFKFAAPASGAVRINSGADFQHILAVWKGNDCNNLSNIFCVENPLRCDGYVTLGGLSAGQVYYLQVASQISAAGPSSGNVCVKLLDGSLPPDFTPLSFVINEKCADVDMASLNFDLSGGLAPFTYSGNTDGEVLPSGTAYFAVVADAMGCEKSFSGVVAECAGSACSVEATIFAVNPKCHNSTDGSLSAMGLGGVGPYTYKWSNGATTAEITGIDAGVYTVSVTDALDCEQTTSYTLTDPAAIVIALNAILQPSQGQSNGAISVDVAGGTGQYSNTWSRNGTVVATGVEDLTNAPAGMYQLLVTDDNGCTAVFEVELTESVSTQEVVDASFTEVFPNPAKDKTMLSVAFPQARTLYLTLSDATGKALHSWTERNVTEQTIPIDLKDLPAGTYQLRMVTGFETISEKVVVVR